MHSAPDALQSCFRALKRKGVSKEATDRRARSLEQLKQEGVPTLAQLPVIEDSASAKARTTTEIAHRAIALCIVAIKGEGFAPSTVEAFIKKFAAAPFFSPQETAFIQKTSPTGADCIPFSWCYEALWTCLWSLGYVEKLDRPEAICPVTRAVSILRNRDTSQFIQDAVPRPLSELLDQADLTYRYHWAVLNAYHKGEAAPAQLHGDVVQERHHTLHWLISYRNRAWDDVLAEV